MYVFLEQTTNSFGLYTVLRAVRIGGVFLIEITKTDRNRRQSIKNDALLCGLRVPSEKLRVSARIRLYFSRMKLWKVFVSSFTRDWVTGVVKTYKTSGGRIIFTDVAKLDVL